MFQWWEIGAYALYPCFNIKFIGGKMMKMMMVVNMVMAMIVVIMVARNYYKAIIYNSETVDHLDRRNL